MSKITFRADDDLVSRIEKLDASKSEVMREALRRYLDTERDTSTDSSTTDSPVSESTTIDDLLTDRLETLLDERERRTPKPPQTIVQPPDVTVNVSVEGTTAEDVSVDHQTTTETRKTRTEQPATTQSASTDCAQCGEQIDDTHVYCPNCGNKASRRLFCECGDEIQSDWGFCPSCGRRTPSADVLDNT